VTTRRRALSVSNLDPVQAVSGDGKDAALRDGTRLPGRVPGDVLNDTIDDGLRPSAQGGRLR